MTAVAIPQHAGEYTPQEAAAFMAAQIATSNRASNEGVAAKARGVVEGTMTEWSDAMSPLFRRWRATNKMLAGNTLDKGGPEDVHVPEIYKALETIIPRMEETVVGLYDPWFRLVPRRKRDVPMVAANSAYLDWQFSQAKVRTSVQPALRDMLISQACAWYCWWDNVTKKHTSREVVTTYDEKGNPRRSFKIGERKDKIVFSGPKATLVDPFDFIIETKSIDPQTAPYVGHRWWMTVDEIKRIGKQMGWQNLDQIDSKQSTTLGPYQNQYAYTSDPTARYNPLGSNMFSVAGRPEKLEVVVLYIICSLEPDGAPDDFKDYRIVIVGGKTIVEVRENPLDGDLRPYAVARVSKSGHHFYSTGPFDNAIRLNQHLDRYHQIFLRGAAVAGMPMVFAEEDSDLPDSLFKVRPFQVYKGVGPVRFTTVPDGFLRSAPLVVGMLQRNIEETTGAFRVNMGQDTGGTASEAQLAFQEGNRRLSGMVRCFGEGLTQLLHIFHRLNQQFSVDDIEFPVLGKRALSLRKQHMTMSPADLLDEVQFEIVGLRNARNYGLKATGWQAFMNTMTPFLMANPSAVDQVGLMHDIATELVGPEEADSRIKVPTPIDQIHSQVEENEGLIAGEEIEVDPDDNDETHLRDLEPLYRRSLDNKEPLPQHVRNAIWKHWIDHTNQHNRKMAQNAVRMNRAEQQRQIMPPEAGGQQTNGASQGSRQSPQRGGFSDALAQLAMEPGGQTPGENPGPADSRKYPRSGGSKRTTNQMENMLQ